MVQRFFSGLISLRSRLRGLLNGPMVLAFAPGLFFLGYLLGGETALYVMAVGLPALVATVGGFDQMPTEPKHARDSITGLMMRDQLEQALDAGMRENGQSGRTTACFLLEIDDFPETLDRYGQTAADQILRRFAERLQSSMRESDSVTRIGDSRFAIGLHPVRHIDLESAIQMAARLQSSIEEPVSLDATTVYMSCTVGFCLASRSPKPTGAALIAAAGVALAEAHRAGPSSIRAYSAEMQRMKTQRHVMMDESLDALENGQIQPWFQPQVSTDTGQVTGFEALARWIHPERGLISPAEFLPALEQAGQMGRLGEIILFHSLTALRSWDKDGLDIPCVGVNFCAAELRNPQLVDKIQWELDRFELEPSRLCVEVLETVVATSPDDMTTRNINGLAQLGCKIDLDDFGTGHASISSIRRFAVTRIKIDRSFVLKSDRDPEQQRMIAAILTMAERLNLDTLAEGVETVGEHAMLAQLGCGHVQGYGIARPMPFEETADWVRRHLDDLQSTPQIGRQTG